MTENGMLRRQFDVDGHLKQWWKNDSIQNFKKKIPCFQDQYSSIAILGSNINGNRTLDENLADNGGLKLAYMAYKSSNPKNFSDAFKLPGVNLTSDQLFFISFAQTFCATQTKKYNDFLILTDEHSRPKARIIGTVSNFVEFSKAFQCPADSPMNPKIKCTLW
ncbi:unnamed protein product [Gordionus sp. m RMFG-2023]